MEGELYKGFLEGAGKSASESTFLSPFPVPVQAIEWKNLVNYVQKQLWLKKSGLKLPQL